MAARTHGLNLSLDILAMPATHTADFQTAAVKATNLDAVEKINVGIETDKVRKHLNIVADAPEIRIQDKTGSAPEDNETTMSIVADGGTTHFRAGTETFAEGTETKGNVKFQSSTGATTHAEIVGSSGKLELQDGGLGLKLGSNVSVTGTSKVIQEITGPHARESAVLKKYPEVVFVDGKFEYNHSTKTYTQGGYTVTASTMYNQTSYIVPYVFNHVYQTADSGGDDILWTSEDNRYSSSVPVDSTYQIGGTSGDFIKLKMPYKIRPTQVRIYPRTFTSGVGNQQSPAQFKVFGSNDNFSTTTELYHQNTDWVNNGTWGIFDITHASSFQYFGIVFTKTNGSTLVGIQELEYYGYEEIGAGDDACDVTIQSTYNAPDLTSASLYLDGLKGSTATDHSGSSVAVTENNVTWDSVTKSWTFSGAATSNLVSGDLASLVGDHPHSVSVWVRADQLNGDGLFHVGTADGAGDAASRVGFVDDSHITWGGKDHYFSNNAEWHNVTYTYNGEGSDKKLYLDGRLVDTAKNEDTFGDYPPAMTTYSQYGYTVSASSSHSSYPPHYAFNDSIEHGGGVNIWITGNSKYNTSGVGTPTSGAATTVVDGTNQMGEWLQLELPHQLKVSYMDIAPHGQNTGTLGRAPKDGIIAGSRDGSTWETMKSWTGVTDWALTGTSGVYKTFVIDTNTDRAYKYIRIIITKTGGFDAYGALSEVKIFGHRENDLVRFPDPTNTLKYPHVVMAGPAHRGYAATSNYTNTAATRRPHNAFTGGGTGYRWQVDNGYSTSGNLEAVALNGVLPTITDTGSTDHTGHWLKLKFPRKIQISRFVTTNFIHPQYQLKGYVLLGSNDDSAWTLIHSETNADMASGSGNGTEDVTTFSEGTPSAYLFIKLLVKTKANSGSATLMVGETYFEGTEPEDVIARVGDGFDGKVRNVRVYSTALSDARVQEIFDADKDEFGLAKSSVSVYRGHLGIGTSEPKAALTVMDEVAELEEFPPHGISVVGVSAAALDVKQHIEGHGVFRMSTSSNHGSAGSVPGAFDKQTNTYWHAAGGAYSGTGGSYPTTGTSSLAGIRGDWLRLELPYKVKLSSIGIRARSGFGNQNTYDQSPEDFTILGNNDNGIWTVIQSFTGKSWSDTRSTTIPITTDPSAYNSFAIVTTRVGNSSGLTIAELRYFGTREQGASTLHNGELSLTRNLTVPRIGPPLDADDTPRRDRLVVEYNTSTNPMENGVVKDTSGRGLDGLLDNTYGGAAYNPYYDASEKALVFDGSNDYVFQNDVHLKTGVGGVYSASVWVRNRASSGTHTVYSLGTYAQLTTSTLYVMDTTLQVVFYNSDLSVTYTIPKNTWTNIVVTHGGGPTSTTTKMYINGVDVGLTSMNGTLYPLSTVNFPSPCNLFLGKNSTNSVYGGPMDLSNFKLWDTELSAEDAKRLYDMGRCDEGHHVVNFSKTRVGIGLGDGEAPRAALDVSGDLSLTGTVAHRNYGVRLIRTSAHDITYGATGTTAVRQIAFTASTAYGEPSLWNATDNFYRCPVAGDYFISGQVMSWPNGNPNYGWLHASRYDSGGTLQDAGEALSMQSPTNQRYNAWTFSQSHACNAGDRIGLFSYATPFSGGSVTFGLHSDWGGMTIFLLRRHA